MEVDADNIIKLILPDGVPDEWKDNPDFYNYLSKLGNYSIEQLSKEPEHLNAEKAAIVNQAQDLAFANYKTFIRTAECSREIFQEFNKMEEKLESLLTEVGGLRGKCEDFGKVCEETRERRRANTLCLTRHASLLHFLEIPQLIETLIREAQYDQALQLANYVARIASIHTDIPIIQSLGVEVEKWRWVVVERLVAELSREEQLPNLLHIVALLARMRIFNHAELRLKFLHARNKLFNSLIDSIPTDDANQHLTKVIEISRTQIFNIVTQYKAVFTEDENAPSSKLGQPPLLQSWINDKVNELCKRLKGCGGGGVLGGCMYLGASLSRVGGDGRGLLAPVLLSSLSSSLATLLQTSLATFRSDMAKFTLPTQHHPSLFAHHLSQQPQIDPNRHAAPSWLLEFYPLSNCCNGLMGCLNQLRHCAPLSLAQTTTSLFTQALTSVAIEINHFYTREQQALSSEEKESLIRMCVCFADHLVPYVQQSIQQIYPPLELANFLGVPQAKLLAQGLCVLDSGAIVGPIAHLLPPTSPFTLKTQLTLSTES